MHLFRRLALIATGLALLLVVAGMLISPALADASSAGPGTTDGYDPFAAIVAQTDTTPEPPAPDHALFPSLRGPFTEGSEVTQACLACHSEEASEVMATTHWTWEFTDPDTGEVTGKKHIINNYCIAIASNEARCTSCHVGYGWTDDTFDFTDQTKVDCLACHDTTGTYKKTPTAAGNPDPAVDLAVVAQSVGLSSRQTCGSCHFFGGGDDAVKHGDLDSSLTNPTSDIDVHMGVDGLNFTCTSCHTTENHDIAGTRYSHSEEDWKGCETCHGETPHPNALLNTHLDRVACQTCHIPEYAVGGKATKMSWDWSTAGQLNEDGSVKIERNEDGDVIYDSRKGSFVWEDNVIPDYIWFNGQVDYITLEDVIDPSQPVAINTFGGDRADTSAKITPVKIFSAIQPYDAGNNTLVIPHLFGSDDAAYWRSYDWNSAIAYGMNYVGAPFSGEVGFVETQMIWTENHMVAPAEEALACADCHTAENSRLDFVALGYSADEISRLTNFPPDLSYSGEIVENTPEYCQACHAQSYDAWNDSRHGNNNVACAACHQTTDGGEHPVSPMSVDRSEDTCSACHISHLADWEDSQHAAVDISCIACHEPHTQHQRLVGDNVTSCENCHRDVAGTVAHSTHFAAGLLCYDCHVDKTDSSGHTFKASGNTCMNCHAGEIHSADLLVQAGTIEIEEPVVEETPEGEAEPQVIGFPTWLAIVLGVLAGGVGGWVVFGRNPGSEAAPQESDETTESAEGSDEESKPEA